MGKTIYQSIRLDELYRSGLLATSDERPFIPGSVPAYKGFSSGSGYQLAVNNSQKDFRTEKISQNGSVIVGDHVSELSAGFLKLTTRLTDTG